MAIATITDVFDCSIDNFFKIISDVEKYSEFLSEVKSCKVVKDEGARKLAEYKVSIPLKTITYSLWMKEEAPHSLTWEFAGGDVFKKLSGSWKLVDEAGKTRATYSLDVEFGMFVPGAITKGLVAGNMPGMMSAYKDRVKKIYGTR